MRSFDEIFAVAAARKGGNAALERALAETASLEPAAMAVVPDDRILAALKRRVLNAGVSSKVIDAKWDAFEAAFERFDPRASAFMTEERFDILMNDRDIVRNGAKIRATQVNARWCWI